MLPSLHDHYIVSYKVECEFRRIILETRRTLDEPLSALLIFTGVEGYSLINDAFGNIVSSLSVVSAQKIIAQFRDKIVASYFLAGAPGPWAADIIAAGQHLTAKGVKGYILESTYGLSGWVLAENAEHHMVATMDRTRL